MSIVPNFRPVEQRKPPHRDPDYREHVASQPCQACGRWGRSNACHIGTYGRGIKNHDYFTIPLCTLEPGKLGCHQLFDAGQKAFAMRKWGMTIDELKAHAQSKYREWAA